LAIGLYIAAQYLCAPFGVGKQFAKLPRSLCRLAFLDGQHATGRLP
jgi:hypothetical protein